MTNLEKRSPIKGEQVLLFDNHAFFETRKDEFLALASNIVPHKKTTSKINKQNQIANMISKYEKPKLIVNIPPPDIKYSPSPLKSSVDARNASRLAKHHSAR